MFLRLAKCFSVEHCQQRIRKQFWSPRPPDEDEPRVWIRRTVGTCRCEWCRSRARRLTPQSQLSPRAPGRAAWTRASRAARWAAGEAADWLRASSPAVALWDHRLQRSLGSVRR